MKNQLEQIKRLDAKISNEQKNLTKEQIKKCLCDDSNVEFCKKLSKRKK